MTKVLLLGIALSTTASCGGQIDTGGGDPSLQSGICGGPRLWVAADASRARGDTSAYWHCILDQSNLPELASAWSTGHTIRYGGVATISSSCGAINSTGASVGQDSATLQCIINQTHWPVGPSDVILYYPGGWGCQDGRNHWNIPVNSGGSTVYVKAAFVFASTGQECQEAMGMHEVYEADSDASAADCCNGQSWTGCGSVPGPYGWYGFSACGGYYYGQYVNPAGHEFQQSYCQPVKFGYANACVQSSCTPQPGFGTPSSCGGIAAGQGLKAGQSEWSCDGRFQLAMQGDGNLVLYSKYGVPMWASNTNGKGGVEAVMQGDGNLVIYTSAGCPVWASNTYGHSGTSLAVQGDGNVVLYQGSTAIWATNTGDLPPSPSGCGTIASGHGLIPGESESSCDGRFRVDMQGDGNLVLYQNGVGALWSSRTNGSAGRYAVMQGDGNLVVYPLGYKPAVWATGTYSHPGAWAAVQNDGNFVLYQGSTPIWASNTCCR